jgi:hypothetical protein
MTEESKIVEKVVSRLTDLRLSLSPQERFFLDELIIGGRAEVTGHKFEVGGEWTGKIAIDDDQYKVEF